MEEDFCKTPQTSSSIVKFYRISLMHENAFSLQIKVEMDIVQGL